MITPEDVAAIERAYRSGGPAVVTRRRPKPDQRPGFDVFGPDAPSPVVMALGLDGVGAHQVGLINGCDLETDPETGHPLDLSDQAIGRAVNPVLRSAAIGRQLDAQDPGGRAVSTTKPPYQVPTMAEIRALPWNGFTAVSTFSGCGGSSTGYRMAGFRMLWASEFVEAAQDSYRANMAPGTVLDTRDIRQVTADDLLAAAGVGVGEIDLFDGSPPCASFSTAGKREAGWGKVKKYSDTAQRTDDLFYEYVRLINGCQPRTFVAENVSGLVKGTAKGYFIRIMDELRGCGYRVKAKVLDAQWLGVPQTRQRLIFIGVREDLGLDPVFPAPLHYRYTVRDALPHILTQGDNGGYGGGAMRPTDVPSPTIGRNVASGNGRFPPSVVTAVHDTSGDRSLGDITDRACPTVTVGVNAVNSNHYRIVHDTCAAPDTAGGGNSRNYQGHGEPTVAVIHDTGAGQGTHFAGGEVTDQPCPTIVAGGTKSTSHHHYQVRSTDLAGWDTRDPETGKDLAILGRRANAVPDRLGPERSVRRFTLGELRRICGFPDDFVLTGSYEQRWERMGRAVPPVMMGHIAATVRDQILTRLQVAP